MFPLGAEYSDVLCPNCRRVMADLARYAHVADDTGGLLDDSIPYATPHGNGGGMWVGIEILNFVVSSISGLITGSFRKRKVQRLCQTLLPEYPKTLICPACLYVLKRRGTPS